MSRNGVIFYEQIKGFSARVDHDGKNVNLFAKVNCHEKHKKEYFSINVIYHPTGSFSTNFYLLRHRQ